MTGGLDDRQRRTADAILIAGPTGSGKSALAVQVAARLGGRIINADSMQNYRDLRLLTARPSEADERRTPHALFGTVDGGTAFSVSDWLAAAEQEITRSRDAGLLPIFVGGTGLYFKALTQGLSAIPNVPPEVRSRVRVWAEGRAPGELHAVLMARDPATAARLRPTDPQRIIRALEVHAATGQGLVSFQHVRQPGLLEVARCKAVYLMPDRDELRARLDTRFDRIMELGALGEVEQLRRRGLDPALPCMRALGVPSLIRYLRGTCDLDEAIAESKALTCQYVKRQDTFARTQLVGFLPADPDRAQDWLMQTDQFA